MSSEQTTLAGVETAATRETATDADDDRDADTTVQRALSPDVTLGSPEPSNECRNCGRQLSPRQARVLGDNDGCVDQCDECTDRTSTANAARDSRTRKGGLRR